MLHGHMGKLRRLLGALVVVALVGTAAVTAAHEADDDHDHGARTGADDRREPGRSRRWSRCRSVTRTDPLAVDVDLNIAGACDELDPRACLLPFPNDRFTVADPTTDTGRRVHLDVLSMPRNVAGKPIDPTEWNRNDGFSPSTPDPHLRPGPRPAPPPGAARSTTSPTSPATSGPTRRSCSSTPPPAQRHPFWSELDQHPGTTDADRGC